MCSKNTKYNLGTFYFDEEFYRMNYSFSTTHETDNINIILRDWQDNEICFEDWEYILTFRSSTNIIKRKNNAKSKTKKEENVESNDTKVQELTNRIDKGLLNEAAKNINKTKDLQM